MNKFEYKNLTPFKWFVLENFPFIEADFDALTEWQLFCKLGKEMNKIINSENTLGTQMENVTNAFIELQNYVNNYFKNLDVQKEINLKLNEMATDGTLDMIINQEIFGDINSKINELEKNVGISTLNPIQDLIYDVTDGETGINGMCVDENDSVYVYKVLNSNSINGTLLKFNLNTHSLIGKIENVPLYHANGLTYINGKLYGCDYYDRNGEFSSKISIYDLATGTSQQIDPFVNAGINRCFGIAKYDNTHVFVLCAKTAESATPFSNHALYLLNLNDFNYEEFTIDNNNLPTMYEKGLLTDIEYYNNKIYLLSSYSVHLFEFNTDIVNKTITLNKEYNIGERDEQGLFYGEVEGIAKLHNSFGKDSFVFVSALNNTTLGNVRALKLYLFNTNTELVPFYQDDYTQVAELRNNNYVTNQPLSNLYENGTITYPFKDLTRAIESCNYNKNKNNGEVLFINDGQYFVSNYNGQKIALNCNDHNIELYGNLVMTNCNGYITANTGRYDVKAHNTAITFNSSNLFFKNCDFTNVDNTKSVFSINNNSNIRLKNCTIDANNTPAVAMYVIDSNILLGISSFTNFTRGINATSSTLKLNQYIKSLWSEYVNNDIITADNASFVFTPQGTNRYVIMNNVTPSSAGNFEVGLNDSFVVDFIYATSLNANSHNTIIVPYFNIGSKTWNGHAIDTVTNNIVTGSLNVVVQCHKK